MPIEVRLATVSSRKRFSSPGQALTSFRQAQNLARELRAAIDTNPRSIRPRYTTVRPGSP